MDHRSMHYELRPFSRIRASLVASWVRDSDELFWLAPQTPPPVSAEKVIGWTSRRGRPTLFWSSDWPEPIGYAEVNDFPGRPGELWIGHFILDPKQRGRGLGGTMLRLLLDQAFGALRAGRVALIVFPENVRAVRCYESGGMIAAGYQDKTFVSKPGVHKMVEMVIERPRYEAVVKPAPAPP